jgi:hypothetical protein
MYLLGTKNQVGGVYLGTLKLFQTKEDLIEFVKNNDLGEYKKIVNKSKYIWLKIFVFDKPGEDGKSLTVKEILKFFDV